MIEHRAQRIDFEPRVRRRLAKLRDHGRHEEVVQIIRRGHAERAARAAGIEIAMRRRDEIHFTQHALRGSQQRFAIFGRHHARLAAHEDRIVQRLAQFAQRGADGGLGLIQTQRGLRDAALDQQRAQHAHEPDIERGGECRPWFKRGVANGSADEASYGAARESLARAQRQRARREGHNLRPVCGVAA